jgi:hypothetical protein
MFMLYTSSWTVTKNFKAFWIIGKNSKIKKNRKELKLFLSIESEVGFNSN